MKESFQLSELKAMECEETGCGPAGTFVVLINVTGTVGHMHKVNSEGGE